MRTAGACSSTCQLYGVVLWLLGALLLPPNSYGGEFRQGLRAYLDGDYQTALALWEPLASQGKVTRAPSSVWATPISTGGVWYVTNGWLRVGGCEPHPKSSYPPRRA